MCPNVERENLTLSGHAQTFFLAIERSFSQPQMTYERFVPL